MNEKICFDDLDLRPWRWRTHASKPGTMLCVSGPYKTHNNSCVVVELETRKTSDRYLDHSALVMDFFNKLGLGTACGDGYARLYNKHLPMLTK
jgi:hypothetical protein